LAAKCLISKPPEGLFVFLDPARTRLTAAVPVSEWALRPIFVYGDGS